MGRTSLNPFSETAITPPETGELTSVGFLWVRGLGFLCTRRGKGLRVRGALAAARTRRSMHVYERYGEHTQPCGQTCDPSTTSLKRGEKRATLTRQQRQHLQIRQLAERRQAHVGDMRDVQAQLSSTSPAPPQFSMFHRARYSTAALRTARGLLVCSRSAGRAETS